MSEIQGPQPPPPPGSPPGASPAGGTSGVQSPGASQAGNNDSSWATVIQETILALSGVYSAFAQNTMFVLQNRINNLTQDQSCWSGKLSCAVCQSCQTNIRNQLQAISTQLEQVNAIFTSTGSNASAAAALLSKCVQTLASMDSAVSQNY